MWGVLDGSEWREGSSCRQFLFHGERGMRFTLGQPRETVFM